MKQSIVICLGSSIRFERNMCFDHLTPNGVNRAKQVGQHITGRPIEIARILKKLGHKPVVTGFLNELTGPVVNELLLQEALETHCIPTASSSSFSLQLTDTHTHSTTLLTASVAATTEQQWLQLCEHIGTKMPPNALIIAGLPLPADTDGDEIVRMLNLIRRHTVLSKINLLIDPDQAVVSISPHLLTDHQITLLPAGLTVDQIAAEVVANL